nr:MAG TPA: hypothetical protein [Caudoviricetes sp.]
MENTTTKHDDKLVLDLALKIIETTRDLETLQKLCTISIDEDCTAVLLNAIHNLFSTLNKCYRR